MMAPGVDRKWVEQAVTVLRDMTDDGNTSHCFCEELQKHESTRGHACPYCAAKKLVTRLEAWEWQRNDQAYSKASQERSE